MSGYLSAYSVPHACIDGNAECFALAYEGTPASGDTWTKRAFKRKNESLKRLTEEAGYEDFQGYVRDVKVLSRVIEKSSLFSSRFKISPSDYSDTELSPFKSEDLARAFYTYSENPYFCWFEKRLPPELSGVDRNGPVWLGLSVSYLSQVLTAFSIAGFVRSGFPDMKIVIGGGLLQSWQRNEAFESLCGRLNVLPWYGSGESFIDKYILEKNTGYACSSDTVSRGFALPSFSFAAGNIYVSPGLVLPYSPTLGCSYGKCAFCSETFEGQPFSTPGNEQAYQGYVKLSEQYDPLQIHFCDHEMSPGLLRRLADGGQSGARWYGFSRIIDDFLDPEYCRGLAESGCDMLCLGIESGSQRVLDGMEKGISADAAGKALVNLSNAEIRTFCYFLFGTPWEDEDSAGETVRFIMEYQAYIGFMNISIFNLPSASPVAAELKTKRFYAGDLSLYLDFEHPAGWGRKNVRAFISKELSGDTGIRQILQRTPPVFTSSHASFTCIS